MFKNQKLNIIIYIFAFIFSIIYLGWRILFTIPWQDSQFAYLSGLILWLCELTSFFTAFVLIANKSRSFTLNKGEIIESNLPDVDIFIATHNEDYEIVYKTLNGCVNIYYPDMSKVHIFIADDTNRLEIKKLADEFSVGYFGLENNKHAKSGNLNNALSQTNSPLVTTFDADMIPYKEFLMETVPYFLADRKDEKPIGLIQTPQSFYNPDIFQFHFFSEQKLPNEQDFFSKSVNVLNNTRGAAVYTGSNTLIRRKAIEEAGGFPTETITEDFELGVRMNIAGYMNYSTTKPMASGLTPTDLRSVIKQRIRWGRGVIKSSYNTNIFFNPKLSFGQKMIYINGYFYWSSFFRRLVYIIAPVLYTVFQIRIVKANVWLLIIFWLPSYLMTKLAMRDVTDSYRTQTWGEIVETVFAPYLVIPIFLESIGISEKAFKVTSKAVSDRNFDYLFAFPYFLLWLLSVYGLITFNYGKYGSELFYGSVISFWLIHHIINLTFALFATLGRPIFRKEERFLVEEKAIIKVGYLKKEVTIVDVSESGLSFISREPIYVKEECELVLKIDQQNVIIRGKVIRIVSKDSEWLYGIKITQLDDIHKNKYHYFIYNRSNDYLTKVRDNWVTIWDDLSNNLTQRFNLIKNKNNKTESTSHTSTVIKTNYPIIMNDEKFSIISFSTKEIEFESNKLNPSDSIIFENKMLKLFLKEKSHNIFGKTIKYQIERIDEKYTGGIQDFYEELYSEILNADY